MDGPALLFERVRGSSFPVAANVLGAARRCAWALGEEPEKIERDLIRLVPRADWARFPHLLIWHGRRVCDARRPRCEDCVVSDLCPASRA